MILVRLACVKHAASVRPEPGSNSCVQSFKSFRLPYPRSLPRANASAHLALSDFKTVLTHSQNQLSFFVLPCTLIRSPSGLRTSVFDLSVSFSRSVLPAPGTLSGAPASGTACIYYYSPPIMSSIIFTFNVLFTIRACFRAFSVIKAAVDGRWSIVIGRPRTRGQSRFAGTEGEKHRSGGLLAAISG